MVTVTLLGRDFDVAPYKLGALRKAAPIVERINTTAGSLTTFEGAVEAACELAALVSIGLVKLDPALTAEALEEQLGMEDMPALQKAALDILSVSGLSQGEAKAPTA
jgi:hypothetical protein